MRQTGGNVDGSSGWWCLAVAVDNRAWNWRHRKKKMQVGDKVCVWQWWWLAAAEIENEGRGGIGVGQCFVLCCGVCQSWPAICYVLYNWDNSAKQANTPHQWCAGPYLSWDRKKVGGFDIFYEPPRRTATLMVRGTHVLLSGLERKNRIYWCGARLGGPKSNAVNLILRFFLYHLLHTMSSWHHESIHNNTNNQQTTPPWWWSRLPLQRHGFNESTPPKGWVALRIYFPRPLSKDFVWFVKLV